MDIKDDSSLTERQRYWFNHIRACDAAGKTSVDYARAHDINVKSLYSARKALAEKGAGPPTPPALFQQVQVVGGKTTQVYAHLCPDRKEQSVLNVFS